VKRFLFISSTSVADRYGVYGHSKILGEEMCRAYAHRHGMEAIILRPRAFIPSWNTTVYASFPEWAAWYARGAVHIADVSRAVLCAVDLLKKNVGLEPPAPIFTIDGAHDFTKEDLDAWDAEGPGSTFRKYYPEDEDLLRKYGLDPARKPKVLNIPAAEKLPGYAPQYGLKNMLGELRRFDAGAGGVAGAP
jgi:nucleoside-diphosphate-sugar epimerase